MPLTSAQIAELIRRESEDAIIFLLTITHPQLDTVRLCRNISGQNVTSRGTEFTAAPILVTPATDTAELPVIELTILNVDRAIGQALLQVSGDPLKCIVEPVLASDPDVPIRRYARFELVDVTFDALVVTGQLRQMRIANEPYPNRRVVPATFPGLFR